MLGTKKRKEIERLRKELQEHIDDAAYWYCEGSVENYNICHARDALTLRKIHRVRG